MRQRLPNFHWIYLRITSIRLALGLILSLSILTFTPSWRKHWCSWWTLTSCRWRACYSYGRTCCGFFSILLYCCSYEPLLQQYNRIEKKKADNSRLFGWRWRTRGGWTGWRWRSCGYSCCFKFKCFRWYEVDILFLCCKLARI